jgi:predicted ATPase
MYEESFEKMVSGRPVFASAAKVYGHKLHLPQVALSPRRRSQHSAPSESKDKITGLDPMSLNVGRFTFNQLCDEAVGAADFIALGQIFDVIYVDNVPQLSVAERNQV